MKITLTTKDPAEILKAIANEARRQAEGEFSFARMATTKTQSNTRMARGLALKDFASFIDQIKPENDMKKKAADDIEADRLKVLAHATRFASVVFRGRGKYDRIESDTLEQARVAASTLYFDRPVTIYAIAYNLDGASIRTAHIENWSPK